MEELAELGVGFDWLLRSESAITQLSVRVQYAFDQSRLIQQLLGPRSSDFGH